ncbi:MAG: 30S ribosomal protein S21 [Patescibacteria group bacterium]
MPEVKVREGESIEEALRRFNRQVRESGIMEELKKREYYQKPSEIKKKERKELEMKISRENR